jgi:glyoxylate reductase
VKPRVRVTFDLPPGPLALLRRHARVVRAGDADGLVCLLRDRVDASVMTPRLRVIAQMAAGFENIDLAAAAARGVVVTNTPDVLTETTADLAFGLILACARGIAKWDAFMRRQERWRWEPFGFLGRDVHHKTLGIVGAGRIGRAVARRARGFGMRVLCCRPVPLERLLRESDFVSLHVPLNASTRHLLGARELARMKRTAVLVNTSRGPVVDERALVRALEAGRIAGAGLDVYEREPALAAGLRGLENVVLLPHIASATVETREAMAMLAVRNAVEVLAGRGPITPVSRRGRPARRGGTPAASRRCREWR